DGSGDRRAGPRPAGRTPAPAADPGPGAAARVPGADLAAVPVPAAVRGLHVAAAVRGDRRVRLLLLPARADLRQLRGGLGAVAGRPVPAQHAHHRAARAGADPAAVLVRGVRAGPVPGARAQGPADPVHRGQPAPAADPGHPALPGVPAVGRPGLGAGPAGVHLRHLLGCHRDPRRVPDRVLRLRAHELHGVAAARADRGRAGRRGRGLAAVLDDHHAAVPGPAGRAGDAGVHLDLQRLPLGAGAHEHRRQAADHLRAEQPARAVLHRQQPAGRGGGHHRPAHRAGVLRAAEAVRRRPHAGSQQGM
ncbi:MAG: ABC transporter, permease protein 2 (cluster 1, maltose/g3p/polyamine/iron), partial [uncultured Corynebacteriales bacterium]